MCNQKMQHYYYILFWGKSQMLFKRILLNIHKISSYYMLTMYKNAFERKLLAHRNVHLYVTVISLAHRYM